MAVGMTCHIPIDITHRTYRHGSVFAQTQRGQSHRTHGIRPVAADVTQLTQCIERVNAEQMTRQRYVMYTFTLGTHPRIGRDSAVYRVLRSSRLYDAHVLAHIWQYVYVATMLPTCAADVDALIRAREQH